jgi:hypothetical protein
MVLSSELGPSLAPFRELDVEEDAFFAPLLLTETRKLAGRHAPYRLVTPSFIVVTSAGLH